MQEEKTVEFLKFARYFINQPKPRNLQEKTELFEIGQWIKQDSIRSWSKNWNLDAYSKYISVLAKEIVTDQIKPIFDNKYVSTKNTATKGKQDFPDNPNQMEWLGFAKYGVSIKADNDKQVVLWYNLWLGHLGEGKLRQNQKEADYHVRGLLNWRFGDPNKKFSFITEWQMHEINDTQTAIKNNGNFYIYI